MQSDLIKHLGLRSWATQSRRKAKSIPSNQGCVIQGGWSSSSLFIQVEFKLDVYPEPQEQFRKSAWRRWHFKQLLKEMASTGAPGSWEG